VSTKDKWICQVCGNVLSFEFENCPVCTLRTALTPEDGSFSEIVSDLHFGHYQVLKHEDGTPIELVHRAMGVTYKAVDVHLRCSVTLKLINANLIGDPSARHRFLREARAAASVRHPNVASVFHLGESGGNYFYAIQSGCPQLS
jgi:hypothetical protein